MDNSVDDSVVKGVLTAARPITVLLWEIDVLSRRLGSFLVPNRMNLLF